MATRKSYSKSFKIEAMRLFGLGEKPASQLAQELGIRRNQLYKWRDQIEGKGDKAFSGPGRRPALEESEIARLKREGYPGQYTYFSSPTAGDIIN